MSTDLDDRSMLRALSLARRGEGRVEPNPLVGCVIVKGDRVLGEGHHRRFGGPHAEVAALRACRADPRGATVYVSLEPCCHQGKTPPCTDALLRAGVARVVIAVADPHPLVLGGGIRRLRQAGVQVDVGVLRAEATELLAAYATRLLRDRPYVIAKWAQSLDGKLCTRTGQSKWLSGEASRRVVHRMRARMDAILVGAGTVLKDDPLLTARDVTLRRVATRVVLDGRLRTPKRCKLVETASAIPTLILTSLAQASSRKAKQLRACGVEVVACRRRRGNLHLPHGLKMLAARGMTNLLVEGGPTILSAFFEADLVDEAYVFVTPRLVGGRESPSALLGRGVDRLAESITPREIHTRACGDDRLYQLRFHESPLIGTGS